MRETFSLIQKLRNKIRIQGNLTLRLSKNVKLRNCTFISKGKCTLLLGEGVKLSEVYIELIGDDSLIEIRKKTTIGHHCYLSAKEGASLVVDNNCMISRNAKLMTSDGHNIYCKGIHINKVKNITIGKHVWLADNTTILKGVEIGDNSIVGINTTVTKSIQSNVIAVGNPAKIVKENIVWER